MIARNLLLVLHLLQIVSWLGIDVGVFYSSFVMRRPGLSTDARHQMRKVMVTLDLAPRISLILMIPSGLGLAYVSGLGFATVDSTTAETVLWLVAVIAVVVFASSTYTLNESEQAVITRFGEPVGEPVFDPAEGLLWVPFDPAEIAPDSIIAEAASSGYLFGAPQKSPQPDLVSLPLLPNGDGGAGLTGAGITLLFVTPEGPFEVERRIGLAPGAD